jgi:hypothetical protein
LFQKKKKKKEQTKDPAKALELGAQRITFGAVGARRARVQHFAAFFNVEEFSSIKNAY